MKIARYQSAAGPERLGIVTSLAGRELLVDVAKAAAARGGPCTPVPPRSMISAGRNFGRRKMESMKGNAASASKLHSDFPTGFIKLGRTLVPHKSQVKRPKDGLASQAGSTHVVPQARRPGGSGGGRHRCPGNVHRVNNAEC